MAQVGGTWLFRLDGSAGMDVAEWFWSEGQTAQKRKDEGHKVARQQRGIITIDGDWRNQPLENTSAELAFSRRSKVMDIWIVTTLPFGAEMGRIGRGGDSMRGSVGCVGCVGRSPD